MFDFVAIDVETANECPSSICQVGVAKYKHFKLVETWSSLVDPEDYFLPLNCAIHGIHPKDVVGAPSFPDVFRALQEQLQSQIVLHHTHFDRTAVHRACEFNQLDPPNWNWLDTARVARRSWEQFQRAGYGLGNLCEHIGFEFEHHDAEEDAKAAGAVFIEACRIRCVEPKDWLKLVDAPLSPTSASAGYDYGEGDPDGHLFGEVVCFTGTLETLRREDAIALAKKAGCTVGGGLTRKTTILVQGDQAVLRARGQEISNKMRKAEEYARKGQRIRLLRESDFLTLVGGMFCEAT